MFGRSFVFTFVCLFKLVGIFFISSFTIWTISPLNELTPRKNSQKKDPTNFCIESPFSAFNERPQTESSYLMIGFSWKFINLVEDT